MKRMMYKLKSLAVALIISFTALTATSCDVLLQILEEASQPVEKTEENKEETKQPSGKTMKKFPAPEE